MAEALGGAVLGKVVSEVLDVIKVAITKTWYFKSELTKMQETISSMKPKVEKLEMLYEQLGRQVEEMDKGYKLLKQAEDLVQKCKKINWQFWKKCSYGSKLDEMNESLKKYVQIDLQLQHVCDGAETLVAVKGLERGSEKGSSSGVPLQKCVAIGFDDPLRCLKPMVLKDSPDGDCSVVVVSAAGGSGKTTLVTMLCHDSDIKRKFDGNIYYATIPENYDIKVVIRNLLGRNHQCDFDCNEVAIQQWGTFLGQNKSDILLVLDDVRSDSIIKDFKFTSPKYKILVTSREAFNGFNTYDLPVLNDQDATSLFRRSAFSTDGNNDIPEDLVCKLVECCKNHPLALSVISGSLKGKPLASWILMSENLSKGNKFSNFHKSIQECLKKSFYLFDEEPTIKQCYMDLGLFPEDQKIAATTLMDMWVHLYNHDDEGLTTTHTLSTISSRNLVTFVPKRKNLPPISHHCEEEYVTQHDMMRELAIHLSNQESLEHRERLIIDTDTKSLPQLPQTVNARILSVSTGVATNEGLPLAWDEFQAPKVEVLVLNFMSNMHPLPKFMQNMESLKVLIITNYGYYFPEILNFPAPQYLPGLTRIRLDHVSISSVSTTILKLENLRKLSLIMCKIGNSFNQGTPNKLSSLLEIDIDSCDDLLTFPAMLCNLVRLKKLCITDCHELTSFSEEFGRLSNLEVLRVASCSKLITLPESMKNLKKLRIVDLSDCLSLKELPPLHIGELGWLQTIYVTGCHEHLRDQLQKLVQDFDKVEVVCDEETSHALSDFKNVKVVNKDPLDSFRKIVG